MMPTIIKRKAVYIPVDFWEILHNDAKSKYSTVTTELKDALISLYGDRLPQNNKSTAYTTSSTTKKETGDEF